MSHIYENKNNINEINKRYNYYIEANQFLSSTQNLSSNQIVTITQIVTCTSVTFLGLTKMSL